MDVDDLVVGDLEVRLGSVELELLDEFGDDGLGSGSRRVACKEDLVPGLVCQTRDVVSDREGLAGSATAVQVDVACGGRVERSVFLIDLHSSPILQVGC